MLSFDLSVEQKALQVKAKHFALEHIRPVSRHLDASGEWDENLYKNAFDSGFLQACVPSNLGGPGMSHLDEAILCEELAWGCAGVFTSLNCNSLASTPIKLAGRDEQKTFWLSRLLEAPRFAAFALTEANAGSDVSAISTRAERCAGGYVINGSKCFCTCGDIADFIVVFANSDPRKGLRGLSAFIVPGNSPGIRIGRLMDKMGQRASRQAELYFENLFVPEENLLDQEGSGFTLAMKTLDLTRASVAAGAVGLARAAFELALEHARTRVQFGAPIINQQAVGFMLADMAIAIDASRMLTYKAAWLADHEQPCSKESAMAKTLATDTAMQCADKALQILGGTGYSKDTLAEKFFRDAKLMQIYEGTNQIQRLVIAKELQKSSGR